MQHFIEPAAWMSHSDCRGRSDINWLPERGESAANAKIVCSTCPVRLECLDYGIRTRARGIWGGTTDQERRKIRRERKRRDLPRL